MFIRDGPEGDGDLDVLFARWVIIAPDDREWLRFHNHRAVRSEVLFVAGDVRVMTNDEGIDCLSSIVCDPDQRTAIVVDVDEQDLARVGDVDEVNLTVEFAVDQRCA